jgi:hypothetical protein
VKAKTLVGVDELALCLISRRPLASMVAFATVVQERNRPDVRIKGTFAGHDTGVVGAARRLPVPLGSLLQDQLVQGPVRNGTFEPSVLLLEIL